jgi:hypothetical protein
VNDRWELQAACRTWPVEDLDDFFPVSEDSNKVHVRTVKVPLGIYQMCMNRCPVQLECLATAIKDNRVGIWGGTTYAQRRAMLRSRMRAKCIRCGGGWMVRYSESGICLACGFSWRVPSRAKPLANATNSPQ